ncbi:hypothetical protein [Legionella hackeliae]|uniref:Uncharacterized protein n=1 Tax=Legionella hackeliae TaxID=449 RepID=A0A0A8UPI2_LEGHA|nr:hypothetical protein [Legionella hackeliae]KTD13919.1 hypothetical protein Lhac_0763 [Legionella hackeliae]CEK10623.1 protein of unknown function [Legionella hackeliae]STX47365.1 Uncharacterised protein [Legionella hackeliae]
MNIFNRVKKEPEGPGADPFTKSMLQRGEQRTAQENAQATQEARNELNGMRKNQKGAASDKLREQVEDNIKKMLDGRSEAYVEWATGMNSLVSYLRVFAEYLHASMGYDALPNISWDKSNSDKLTIKGDKAHMPEVNYTVAMDDTGHIKTSITADNQAITPQEKQFFDAALSAWAKDRGYTLQVDRANPSSGFTLKNDTTGDLVTDKAVFDNLKQDQAHGLHSYLKDRFAMALEEREENTPTVPGP